jgi:hypothetical protein
LAFLAVSLRVQRYPYRYQDAFSSEIPGRSVQGVEQPDFLESGIKYQQLKLRGDHFNGG